MFIFYHLMYRNSLVKRNLFDIQYPKYSRIDCQLLTISSKVKIVSTYLTYLLIEIVEHFGQRRKDRVAQQRERETNRPANGEKPRKNGKNRCGIRYQTAIEMKRYIHIRVQEKDG